MRAYATVLHAEDDPNDVFFMQQAFREAGLLHPLVHVSSGLGVIDYLEGNAPYGDRARFPFPGLVLLDLKMPGMNGFQLLEWRQQRPGLAGLPVVVLSASDDAGDRLRARELGASEYRLKPLAFGNLVGLVRELRVRWLAFQQAPLVAENPAWAFGAAPGPVPNPRPGSTAP